MSERAVWEKTWIMFPRIGIDGSLVVGNCQVWRKPRKDVRWWSYSWHYFEEDETHEEWLDRQW